MAPIGPSDMIVSAAFCAVAIPVSTALLPLIINSVTNQFMEKELCNVPNCASPKYANGMCHSHDRRMKKYGDPLGGRTFNGVSAQFLDNALLSHSDECIFWTFANVGGYGVLVYEGKRTLAHVAVCTKKYGPKPDGLEACHSCGNGNKGCINPKHLRWGTHISNMLDKKLHGTQQRGSDVGGSKLTESQVAEIRIRISAGDSKLSISRDFGVSPAAIYNIESGKSWGWLPW